MRFDFSLETNDGTYYCAIGEVDFKNEEDPINILTLKFPPGSDDQDVGEEMTEQEIKALWAEIRSRVEMFIECKSLVEGSSLIN